MMILKCKMCGGKLEVTDETSVCECEFCGSKQTIPTIDDEKIVKLYDRANRLRMANEFDMAAGVYESIIAESDTEAEAYWGLLLCKYGIEYVDDPATGNKVPTCHRSSFDSIMEDPDFDMVMENADVISKRLYREQAKQIEEIRKGIIEVSGKEKPYDIFICYKETDENGDRTIDSVIAQDVYDALTNKKYRVFFARISLEEKLGSEYEPYIFAALNSAKIMLVFGTNYDYFNAVWVKNEWSRYLQLMAKDKEKHLIPCYKDIDAYDIPKEFKHLQAQNMGKVGAEQDLLRGIDKILRPDKDSHDYQMDIKEAVANVITSNTNSNVEALLERGFMSLEDEDFDKADGLFEDVLNQNPKCAEAYLGKFCAVNKVNSFGNYITKIKNKYSTTTAETLYACEEETTYINSVVKKYAVKNYLEEDEIRRLYVFDRSYVSALSCRQEQKRIIQAEIDSDRLLSRLRQYATGEFKEQIESEISELFLLCDARIAEEQQTDEVRIKEITEKYQAHIERTDIKVMNMRIAVDRIRKEERIARKRLKIGMVVISSVVAVIVAIVIVVNIIIPSIRYNQAIALRDKGQYEEAIAVFEDIDGYKDSAEQIESIKCEQECEQEIDYIRTLAIGDTFYYGNYDGEAIKWTILDIQNNQVLAITTDAIDKRPYNDGYAAVTWSTCSLRTWLNENFLDEAFSMDEQSRILTTTVSTGNNPDYGTDGGRSTNDKIFLLSIEEVNQYFSSDQSRRCEYNGYSCWWWLRSPGNDSNYAADVCYDGSVFTFGYYVYYDLDAVRPAFWINLES